MTHPGSCSRHQRFFLTCSQTASLYDLAGHACMICRIPEGDTRHGILAIDHDAEIGYAAVRGLLCQTCNSGMDRGRVDPVRLADYLANPWHEEVGLSVEPVDLPEIPDCTVEEATRLLVEAAAFARSISSRARPRLFGRARRDMIEAVRIAAKAGMRHIEIVEVIDTLWTREQVYNALHEGGRRLFDFRRTTYGDALVA